MIQSNSSARDALSGAARPRGTRSSWKKKTLISSFEAWRKMLGILELELRDSVSRDTLVLTSALLTSGVEESYIDDED